MSWFSNLICKLIGRCCIEKEIRYGFSVPEGNAVIAAVYRDANGNLALNVPEIGVDPGQTVLITSKEDFSIHFKDGESPTGKPGYTKKNGVVAIDIPDEILGCKDWENYSGEPKVYNFDIQVGDETLDPPIIIPRRSANR